MSRLRSRFADGGYVTKAELHEALKSFAKKDKKEDEAMMRHKRADGGAFETTGKRNSSFGKAQGPSAGKPKWNAAAGEPETDMDGERMARNPGHKQAPRTLARGGFAKAQSVSAGKPKWDAPTGEPETNMDGEPMAANPKHKKVPTMLAKGGHAKGCDCHRCNGGRRASGGRLGPDQATTIPGEDSYRRGGHKKRANGGDVNDGTEKTSIPGLDAYRKGGRARRDVGGGMPFPPPAQGAQGAPGMGAAPNMQGMMNAPAQAQVGQQSPYRRGGQPKSEMPYKKGGRADGGREEHHPGMMIVIGMKPHKEKRATGGSLEGPTYLDNKRQAARGTGAAKRGKDFMDA